MHLLNNLIKNLYPVNSIYMCVSDSCTFFPLLSLSRFLILVAVVVIILLIIILLSVSSSLYIYLILTH